MVSLATQVCLVLSAFYSLVCAQAPLPTDPGLGNPFGQFPGTGGTLDPNFIPNFGIGPTDPNAIPNGVNPGFPGQFPLPQPSPLPPPLPRPSPLQSMLPLMMFRGGDMGQMFALMSLFGGAGGGFASNPLLMWSLLGNM